MLPFFLLTIVDKSKHTSTYYTFFGEFIQMGWEIWAGGPGGLDQGFQRLRLGILWLSGVLSCMRSRPRSSVFATTLPFQLTLPILRSAGPRKEGALVCSKGTNLGPAQQSSAGLLHFERWQGNWSHSSEHNLKERSDAQIIVSR